MKPYHILKSFPGSQTGLDYDQFVEGTVRDLSDSLAAIALNEGWVKPYATGGIVPPNPAQGAGETPSEHPAGRETKVTGPDETKPAKPLDKMTKAELVTHAKTVHDIDLVPDNMTVKEMIAAIEAKASE